MSSLHNALRRSKALLKAYKNALGMQDAEAGVERLSETLQPSIDLWERPEWALLRGEELFSIAQTQAAGGAGTSAKIGIFNPATNTGVLVVVLNHHLSIDAPAFVELYPLSTPLGNTATVQMLDRRRTVSHGAVIHFEASAAAGANLMHIESVTTSVGRVVELPVILPPGQGFMWRLTDDAALMRASFDGYQRAANAGELV